ncbi:S49 family peptidase [Rhizobium leguminosarum]|uniref:S49 family peptidase n=1 Tax=Rhizobium leguminosarum TaxID=384 RepID=UPI0021B0D971|nr:S49 family peptidase [Rhizobium leguminosarum]
MADDFWPASDSWLATYRPYIVKSGILLIPVKGVLVHGMGFALGSYATGYVYITKALERGLADREVKGIAFICDSPGGHVAGNFELVDKIYGARGQKPMRGYAAESAYSACYSIISATDPGYVTVSRTGGVGSIGVVTMHIDVSKAMDNEGIKVTFIHYGKHKVDGNAYEALPKDVKDRIQARIDGLGEIFVSTVARNRGMDAKAVRDTEALTFTAEEATSNGLADTIGSLDDAIAVFAADMSNQEEDDMSTQEQLDAAVASAKAEGIATGKAEGKTEGAKEGAAAERSRWRAVTDSEEGRRRPVAAVAALMDTDMTAEQATSFLAKLPEERPLSKAEQAMRDAGFAPGRSTSGNLRLVGNGSARDFQAAMDDSEHPEVGATGGQGHFGDTLTKAQQALFDAGFKPKSSMSSS